MTTPTMTFDEFVAWEPEQEQRHELVAGRVSLMPGVAAFHAMCTAGRS